jgi:hypothetical protein
MMNSADVSTLKKELDRFAPKPCRSCQFILGFGVFVFLVSLTLALFAYKGVPPSSVIPVESIPRDRPLTHTEEKDIMDDLRALAQEHKNSLPLEHADPETHAKSEKGKIVIDSSKPTAP